MWTLMGIYPFHPPLVAYSM